MNKGDIIYVYPRGKHVYGNSDGQIMIYQETISGEDVSLHGSPQYEEIIICTDLKTGKSHRFGALRYSWTDPVSYISYLKKTLAKIRNIAQSV